MTAAMIPGREKCKLWLLSRLTSLVCSLGVLTLLFGMMVGAPPVGATPYTIVDLGRLGGPPADPWRSCVPNAINASGQVVGFGDTGKAFLNGLTGMNNLGALVDPGYSEAFSINDAGQIVGASQTHSGFHHAWLYSDGIMRDLGTLGGIVSRAYDINNAGQVVGEAQIRHPNGLPGGASRAFLYDAQGGMRDLGTLGGSAYDQSRAYAVNNMGQVVGQSATGLDTVHACLWENGAMRDLGALPGYPISAATDINDAGQVIGWSMSDIIIIDTPAPMRAFLYQDGIKRDLGTLGGNQSRALGINNAGTVVGWSWSGTDAESRRAFLYADGEMLDLNSLLPPDSGWTLLEARAINNLGQIVGVGILGGIYRPFLMSPVFEPRALPAQAPTALSSQMVSLTQLDLAWTDHSNNETGFELQLKINGEWTTISLFPANTTRFSHTRLQSYADYSYRVRAVNGVGGSDWSNELHADTGVRPDIQISPVDIDFGSQPVGSQSTRTVEVRNVGNGALVLGEITLSGGRAGEFTLGPASPAGTTLAPGASGTVTVVFTPRTPHEVDPPGSSLATRLTLAHDDPDAGALWVVLRGGGIGPAISLSPASHDFGIQPLGSGGGAQVFLLQNTGNAALDISSVQLTGANPGDFAVTSDGLTGAHLLPGQMAAVSIRFSPTVTGSRSAQLTLQSNAAPAQISLTGAGAPPPAPTLALTPSSLSFGPEPVGLNGTLAVLLHNTGQVPVSIGSIAIQGPHAAEFSLPMGSCSGASLLPGAICLLNVRFSPAATGNRSAVLVIPTDVAGSPHLVPLTGTGTAPLLRLSAESLRFIIPSAGEASAAQTLTFTNHGDAPLAIEALALAGPQAGSFQIVSDSGEESLDPGARRTVKVAFRPAAQIAGTRLQARIAAARIASTGYAAVLEIRHNDLRPGSPRQVPLTAVATAPASPAPLKAVASPATPNRVELTWADNSPNEGEFVLLRRTATGLYGRIAVLPPNTTSYVDTTASPNTNYSYIMRAVNSLGPSAWTNEAGVTTPVLLPPAAATPLRAVAVAATRVELSWTDRNGTESQFVLLRKTGNGLYARIAVLEPDTTSYIDTTAQPGTSYSYIMRAVNGAGASPWTNELGVTTPDGRPAAPTPLRAVAVAANRVELTWQASPDATQYVLLRKVGAGLYQRVGVVGASTTSFVDTTAHGGTSYTYIMRAVNVFGVSAWTNQPSVTTP